MSADSHRDERRRRYLTKQEANAANISQLLPHKSTQTRTEQNESERNETISSTSWISRNSHMCLEVTLDDVKMVKEKRAMIKSNIQQTDFITSDTDNTSRLLLQQRLDHYLYPYFDLQSNKDLPDVSNSIVNGKHRRRPRFIAEGTETIRLLIQQQQQRPNDLLFSQPIQIESIFVKSNIFFDEPVRLQKEIDRDVTALQRGQQQQPPPFHVMLGSVETISAVAGFTVSRGCLACGYIPINRNEDWFFEYLRRCIQVTNTNTNTTNGTTVRILALDGINDTANLGSMIRSSSAFGVHAIVLSQDCCDAWYRRSIRVSMGHVFRIPIIRVPDLSQTIKALSQPPYSVTSYAAVVDRKTSITLNQLKIGDVPNRWCCVMGNESRGVTAGVIESCRFAIRINMEPDVDSLSVPIATGILLHGIVERENKDVDEEDKSE